MEYHFDIEHAQRYGVDEAIMIYNFRYWILKNKANGRHDYDGRTWTYNSVKAFEELFPFWSVSQLKRVLKSLTDKGVLIKGNYNASSYDKTTWYAFADEDFFLNDKCISENEPIDWSKSANRMDEISQPIPNNKQQIKNTDKKTNKGVPTKIERFKEDVQKVYEELEINSEWQEAFNIWFDYRIERYKGNKSEKELLTPIGIKNCIKSKREESDFSISKLKAGIEYSSGNGWQGLYFPPENNKPKLGIDGIPMGSCKKNSWRF